MKRFECDNGHVMTWDGDSFCTTCFDAWAARHFPLREIRMESNAPTESETPPSAEAPAAWPKPDPAYHPEPAPPPEDEKEEMLDDVPSEPKGP